MPIPNHSLKDSDNEKICCIPVGDVADRRSGYCRCCDYHNKSYTMAKNATEAPLGKFVLTVDGKRVMKRDFNPGQTV